MALPERQRSAFDFFTQNGLSPVQAAGLVGNFVQESGSSLDPSILGDNGASLGIAQWQGERRTRLESFAQRAGTSPTDFRTQLQFVLLEGRTTEKKAFDQLMNATTIEEAVDAGLAFERPGKPARKRRIKFAEAIAGGRGTAPSVPGEDVGGAPPSVPAGTTSGGGEGTLGEMLSFNMGDIGGDLGRATAGSPSVPDLGGGGTTPQLSPLDFEPTANFIQQALRGGPLPTLPALGETPPATIGQLFGRGTPRRRRNNRTGLA